MLHMRLGRFAAVAGLCAMAALPVAAADDDAPKGAIPTFSKEVVRIFQENCQNCHRPGVQFTPMALMDYDGVRPWAKSIKKAVADRMMPPWHADPAYGKWKNDISLSQSEIDTIVKWVDAGAPEGNKADLPEPIKFAEGWQIGEPDVVIDMGRDFEVPAEGAVPYQYFSVKTDFGEDKWIERMEARAGNLDVVHHIVMYVRNPAEGIPAPDTGFLGNGLLGALSPGNTPSMYEAGEGKLIKRGATIVFNMHYNTNGTAATDRSYVGFKFHKGPVKKQVITRGIENMRFVIPPNDANFEVKSSFTFPDAVTLKAFMPHMHYRGKAFKYTAVFPDGKEQVILDVPRYQFDWQVYYYPIEPIKLPAGSRLDCVAHYDNSSANPLNPDPNQEVRFGEQTFEEMMIGWLDYTVDKEDLTQAKPAETEKSAGSGGQ
jgi:mono/diheme cytochrome c family protein